MSKQERLGKRNLQYNTRRRLYGNLPATDIDFMEYKNGKAIALIETKFGNGQMIDLNDDQFEAMCDLAAERIPVICLIYYPLDADGRMLHADSDPNLLAHIQFVAIGVNQVGQRLLPRQKQFTEKQWVAFMHELRGDTEYECYVKLYDTWKPVKISSIIRRLAA